MKTYPLRDNNGVLRGFEVPSIVGRGSIRRVLESTVGLQVTAYRGLFARNWEHGEEAFCKLLFNGAPYIVFEPFGDNSRFAIVPESDVDPAQTAALMSLFSESQMARWAFGRKPRD